MFKYQRTKIFWWFLSFVNWTIISIRIIRDEWLQESKTNFTSYSLVDISVSATNYSCRHHSFRAFRRCDSCPPRRRRLCSIHSEIVTIQYRPCTKFEEYSSRDHLHNPYNPDSSFSIRCWPILLTKLRDTCSKSPVLCRGTRNTHQLLPPSSKSTEITSTLIEHFPYRPEHRHSSFSEKHSSDHPAFSIQYLIVPSVRVISDPPDRPPSIFISTVKFHRALFPSSDSFIEKLSD